MNSKIQRNSIIGLSNVYELLDILNQLAYEETQNKDLCFEMRHLYSFANLESKQRKYKTFTIPKKNKGKRIISAPATYLYSQLLKAIKNMLQLVYRAPRCAHGFIPEKSIVTNARLHQGKTNIYNTDLKDFFVSITASRVYEALKAKPFCFDKSIAKLIANICCANASLEGIESRYMYCLPQGSPASPILTNIVCQGLDRALVDFANRYNATYTRYADDITFSSNNWQVRSKSFNRKLSSLICSFGLKVNPDKTRASHVGERMEVTGLLVSEHKVNVSRKYVWELRNLLYIWETYGYEDAERSLRRFYAHDNKPHKGSPSLDNVIHGKLMYLKMVKGEDDMVYQKMYYRYQYLINHRPQSKNKDYKEQTITTNKEPRIPMKTIVFFDTECNGLPRNYKAAVSDTYNWPRLIQLAWIVTDEQGNVQKRRSHIIYPQGFTIDNTVANLTGINTARAQREGINLQDALNEFMQDVAGAEKLVGHNIDFDRHIVGCELYRTLGAYNTLLNKSYVCTMQASTDYCAIPSNSPYGGYKWPKLEELYRKLFGCMFDNAHDALADVTATKECYFELKKIGII